MKRKAAFVAGIVFVVACSAVHGLSTGGPGGKWPATWPKELEGLRKQAWTWQHEFHQYYDIPFGSREEFEAAWPHILKVKDKGASITLVRGAHLLVGPGKEGAGVRIDPAHKWVNEGPYSMTRIVLVVDGNIVDLNRIPLPADTVIIDERFTDGEAGAKGAKAGGGEGHGEPRPATTVEKGAPAARP